MPCRGVLTIDKSLLNISRLMSLLNLLIFSVMQMADKKKSFLDDQKDMDIFQAYGKCLVNDANLHNRAGSAHKAKSMADE